MSKMRTDIPAVVSNGRSPQTVKGLPLGRDYSNAAIYYDDVRPFNVPTTGYKSAGPFSLPERDVQQQQVFKPNSYPAALQVTPGETRSTALSRALKPDQAELDAANNGMRWHWALENRFMSPGSKWTDTVLQGVDRENAWLAQMLRQQMAQDKAANASLMSPVASERRRSTMANMWKTFLSDIRAGHFDAYGGTSESAQDWADKFRSRYNEVFGAGSDVDLAPEAEVLGKRTELARKNLQDYRNNLNMTENVVENLSDWISNGDFNDTSRLTEISTVLDKVGQNITASLGGDSKSMADAEKVRIQIQYLPAEAKKWVYETIKRYRNSLRNIMQSGVAKAWSQNNYGKLNKAQQAAFNNATTLDDKEVTDTSAMHVIATLGDIVAKLATPGLSNNEAELPTELSTALKAAEDTYKSYMDNMVLAANVAPNVIYEFAKYLHRQAKRGYNIEVETLGRGNNKWTNDILNIKLNDLRTLMPPDELMMPPDFPMAQLEAPPSGGLVTSNPQSTGEQQPAAATNLTVTTPIIGL